MKLRDEIAVLEKRLYNPKTPGAKRSEISMRVSILRQQYAKALRIQPWTATAALESAVGEEEVSA